MKLRNVKSVCSLEASYVSGHGAEEEKEDPHMCQFSSTDV